MRTAWESHRPLQVGGKGRIIISPRLRRAQNNSPGNQFPSRLLQTTDGPRKKENERDRPREALISPFHPCCIFLPSFTAQTISTAECTGRKKTSAVDHDKQSASPTFVSLKNHRAAWVKATAAASSWTSFCIKSWRKGIKLQKCSCWWIGAVVYSDTNFIKGGTPILIREIFFRNWPVMKKWILFLLLISVCSSKKCPKHLHFHFRICSLKPKQQFQYLSCKICKKCFPFL